MPVNENQSVKKRNNMHIITFTTLLCAVVVATVHTSAVDDQKLQTFNERIVGGQNAVPHIAPYMVSLHYLNRQHCGAAIISPSWVVTAAHCLIVSATGQFEVLAGRHNILVPEPASEQRRPINRARTWSHPLYHGPTAPYDIAMIHVAPAFTFNAFVSAIALPAPGLIHHGLTTVFGWGISGFNPITLPAILQTADRPIIPWAQCLAILTGSSFHSTKLCAGPLTGGISSCTGDSGGPLVQNGQLVGIVSWGSSLCGVPNSPGVYVRISAFNDWIASIMVL